MGSSSSGAPLSVGGFTLWGIFVDSLGSVATPGKGMSPLKVEPGDTVSAMSMTVLADPPWSATNPPPSSAYPFVGMIMEFGPNKQMVNLSVSPSISITYKSAGPIRMAINQVGMPEGQEWGIFLEPSVAYTTVVIPWTTLEQPSWVTTATALDKTKVNGVKWELKNTEGGTGSISISDLKFTNWTPVAIHSDKLPNAFSAAYRGNQLVLVLPESGLVEVDLLDLMGRPVQVLSRGYLTQGIHAMQVEVPQGMHILRVKQGKSIYSTQLR